MGAVFNKIQYISIAYNSSRSPRSAGLLKFFFHCFKDKNLNWNLCKFHLRFKIYMIFCSLEFSLVFFQFLYFLSIVFDSQWCFYHLHSIRFFSFFSSFSAVPFSSFMILLSFGDCFKQLVSHCLLFRGCFHFLTKAGSSIIFPFAIEFFFFRFLFLNCSLLKT